MFYGFVGEVARIASTGTETNPVAASGQGRLPTSPTGSENGLN